MSSIGRRAAVAGASVLALGVGLCSPGAASAAATYTVDTAADSGPSPSECQGAPGDCSLRQALDIAQSGDTVVVPAGASAYTIVNGALPVRGGVTIEGAGASSTTVSGNGAQQAFDLLGGPPVTIRDLTITNTRDDSGEAQAGAINGQAKAVAGVTLEAVTISDSSSPGGYGGALQARGEVVVRHSRFVDDTSAQDGEGGGGAIDLLAGGSSLTISDSVFTEDSSGSFSGGAILVERKDRLSVAGSTFSANSALSGGPGGAIEVLPESSAAIVNSTFTNNTAGSGGAIASEGETLTLNDDTLASNGAEVGANLAASVGTAVSASNTIFAAPFGGGANCAGGVSSGGHDLEDASPGTCGLSAAAGDLRGASPQLGPLADNSSQEPTAGGPPQTMALASTSPAIGSGSAATCAEAGSVDERGFPRPGGVGASCDIGAYELLPAVATATAIGSSQARTLAGQSVTFTAAVTAARSLPSAVPTLAGAVEFRDGATPLASVPLDPGGHASLTSSTLALGGHAVSAVYRGDAVYASSSSPAVEESVAPPAPVLSALTQSHRSWREGRRLAVISRAPRIPVGTTFSFQLSAPASLTLSFERSLAGRRAGRRCVRPGRRNRRRARCVRLVPAGTLALTATRAGVSRIGFQGRLTRTRRLAPGSYVLLLSARNVTGATGPTRIAFTILAG